MNLTFWRRGGPERKSIPLDDWPWTIPPPESLLLGGGLLSMETAVGLPALLACLFRLGEGVGMLPQLVYSGRSERRHFRERATDTWQWELLHDRPSYEAGPMAFRGELAIGVAGVGKAFVRKYKGSSGKIVELIPLDPRKVRVRRSGGRLVFDDSTEGGEPVTRTSRDILYVRGMSMNGKVDPISRISAARVALQLGLSRQAFALRYFTKNARPGTILKFPEKVTREQAEEWVDWWEALHKGLENAWQTAAIGGGADVTTLPVSLEDAQFVEAARVSIEEIGGLFGIPKAFIHGSGALSGAASDADRMQLVTFALGPLTTAIDEAFNADQDLFPRGSDLFCEHLADALLKPDTRSRYEAYKAARQAGWLTANEIRALENYPPLPGGDELQQTPVGGAPNDDEAAKAIATLEAMLRENGPNEILAQALRRAYEAGFELDDETKLLLDLG